MTVLPVLRVYDPHECDGRGVPLDWERCRACGSAPFEVPGIVEHEELTGEPVACDRCDGHGSLRAAALAAVMKSSRYSNRLWPRFRPGDFGSENLPGDKTAALDQTAEHLRRLEEASAAMDAEPPRCEGCGHPMGVGTFDQPRVQMSSLPFPSGAFRGGDRRVEREGGVSTLTYYSPCDEGCDHGGPVRVKDRRVEGWAHTNTWVRPDTPHVEAVEASWRAVDVRPLGWPHDLCVSKLVVLCLTCLAAR